MAVGSGGDGEPDSPDPPASRIDPAYMRLLPATDAMHDIDTAPLREPDTGAMTPAAVAWLRQHLAQDGSPLPVRH
ncbi:MULTISPECIES: hypothetical protein [Streptomyces]|uniref:hypothetical protein n=1 Tax=Streptomyces TaxID=1883 RepID=UPI00039EC218|nr:MULTISPECIES: hypothetical protein [Streptomyces]MBZ6128566.1 hypothetical protein [Streptomyces olivaceus]MBZ6162918.1 hypothetical protein [Streptomyces olivaceus]MBZ6190721.1 hypothetical protein [Streptomyces olivaceus]MBZ6211968.1 hypothetical protein [Streptomyces olivaceus]MBZ6225408.1 hypothetical protein [Streptomyces olivaceus]